MVPLAGFLLPLPASKYMHIPDGYLSPATAMVMFLLLLPFWIRGVRSLRQRMTSRNVPLIALFAAFSFRAPFWFWAALMGVLLIVAIRRIAPDRPEPAPVPA